MIYNEGDGCEITEAAFVEMGVVLGVFWWPLLCDWTCPETADSDYIEHEYGSTKKGKLVYTFVNNDTSDQNQTDEGWINGRRPYTIYRLSSTTWYS